MQLWRPEFKLVGISSGSWYHCLTVLNCLRKENLVELQPAEMRMVRWMCGVKLKGRLPSKELRERLGIDDIALVLQQNRLR